MEQFTYNIYITGRPGSGKHNLRDILEARTVCRRGNTFTFRGHVAVNDNTKSLPHIDFAVVLIKSSDDYDGFVQNSYIQQALDLTPTSRTCIVGTHCDLITRDYSPKDLRSRRHATTAAYYHSALYFSVSCIDGQGFDALCEHIVDIVTASRYRKRNISFLPVASALHTLKNSILDLIAATFSLPVPKDVNRDTPDLEEMDDDSVYRLISSPLAEAWRSSLKDRVQSTHASGEMPTHRISPNLIVKTNANHERTAVDYVRRHTRIPIPQIRHRNLQKWMAFEFIEGDMLIECLDKKSLFMQFRITCTMRCYLAQLRRLKGPMPGRLNDHVVSGPLFDCSRRGPFQSLFHFQSWCEMIVVAGWCSIAELYRQTGRLSEMYPEPSVGELWALHYAHGDLNTSNCLLSKDGVLWVIDWAESGFYPSGYDGAVLAHFDDGPRSWQYMRSFIAGGRGDVMYKNFWGFFNQGMYRFLESEEYKG